MNPLDHFRDSLPKKSLDEILAIFATAHEYDPEALKLARLEVSKRNIPLDQVDAIEKTAREQQAIREIQEENAISNGGGYFERHWFGELSLPKSYWLNGFCINMVAGIILAVLEAKIVSTHLLLSAVLFACILWPLTAVVIVWQLVGVWRCAGRYLKQHKAKAWAYLARGCVLLTAVTSGFPIGRIGFLQVGAFLNVLRGDPSLPPTHVTVLPSGLAVEYDGGIRLGSAWDLAKALENAPHATTLYLDTPGGRISEANQMAEYVRSRHMSTYVEHVCASAGTIVFLAGDKRTVRTDARLGFHSYSMPGLTPEQANREQIDILQSAGAKLPFIVKATSTSSDTLWFPTGAELTDNGVVTRVTDGLDLPPGVAELSTVSEKSVGKELQTNSLYRVIQTRDPVRYAAALSSVVHNIRNGQSYADATSELRSLVGASVAADRQYAGPDALDRYLAFMVALIDRNKITAPRETLMLIGSYPEALGWTGRLLDIKLPGYPHQEEMAFMEALYASPLDRSAIDVQSAQIELRAIVQSVLGGRSDAGLLSTIPKSAEDQNKACELYQEIFSSIQQTDRPERTELARYLIRSGSQ